MPQGYCNQLLTVDLTEGVCRREELNADWAQEYTGGVGLATKYLSTLISPDTKPDAPENPLIFMTGPVTGTASLTSGRHHVVGLSPLSGIYGESDVGGSFGEQLKMAGLDGIIITGRSDRFLYLWIDNGHPELRNADFLRENDTFETDRLVREATDMKATVAAVGPAAERGALICGIMHDGVHARAAGRCGLGSLMAMKGLKAVAVKGRQKVSVADPDGLNALVKEYGRTLRERLADMGRFGTARMVAASEQIGGIPLGNWQYPGRFEEGAAKLAGPAMKEAGIIKRPYFCRRCVIGCGNEIQVESGPYQTSFTGGPEYETLALLGANLLIDNAEAICLANELCNRFGMDTIEAGSAAGMAFEAFEKGLISPEDTGGVPLKWGDADAMLELVRQMGENRHLGAKLNRGLRQAVIALGPDFEEMAIHVRGVAIPAHDPRNYNGLACSYATSNRGASHLSGQTHTWEHRLAIPELNHEPPGRFVVEGKGRLAALSQNVSNVLDSLKSCKFAQFGGWTIGPLTRAFQLVTGSDIDLERLIENGERSFNLKRLINMDRGVDRATDVLPKRMLTLPKQGQGYNPQLPPLDTMLDEYYDARGWNADGRPSTATIKRLRLR